MTDASGSSEESRLEYLEGEVGRLSKQLNQARREVRALQWLALGVSILGAGALYVLYDAGLLRIKGLGQNIDKTVESKEFGLYNRDGNRVMLADYDKFGYPNLVFMDLKKKYKMGVKVWPEGGGTPGMVFYDDSGLRGTWRMDENHATALTLTGSGKKGKIQLAVSADGDPSVIVVDKDGKVLFEIPAGARDAQAKEDPAQSQRRPDRPTSPAR